MQVNQRKKGTKTGIFGSLERINHDSTHFYKSRLYEGLPREETCKYVENPILSQFLDKIFCKINEKRGITRQQYSPDGYISTL